MWRAETLPSKMGESCIPADDFPLEATRTILSNLLKRHGELTDRLSRDSDKMIFERLQREFEAARASQNQEIFLDGEQWNDGVLATIRERVHMEADIKSMQSSGDVNMVHMEADIKSMQSSGDVNMVLNLPFTDKITYKVGNKVICCMEGARIGIQYETSFAGEPYDLYHCVLESKSFLDKMTVLEHTIPFFLPIREAENEFLSSNAMKFIDYVGDMLQAYIDRREQVRLIKELYGNQIKQLYHSLPYNKVDFVLNSFDCNVVVSLEYADLVSVLPSGVNVVAWPKQQSNKSTPLISKPVPERLSYAENALRTMSLPEAYAEIVLNLSQALEEVFPHSLAT